MIYWEEGKVSRVLQEDEEWQILDICLNDGQRVEAIHYRDGRPKLWRGERVLLNATARKLSLGTGGYDFVHSRQGTSSINRENDQVEISGHMMKLRYTPLQRAVLCVEEENSPYHDLFSQEEDLQGMPVLIGELHSMLPIVFMYLRFLLAKNHLKLKKIVYIMSDGAALPLQLSWHARHLKKLGLHATITYGQAYGGDLEAVNKFSALIAAKRVLQADAVIMAMGPGIAGTGSTWGYSGTELGEMINAAFVLNGKPVVMARVSFSDQRTRHYGISHHTITSLEKIALAKANLPLPDTLETAYKQVIQKQLGHSGISDKHHVHWVNVCPQVIEDSLLDYPEPITTMNRTFQQDPGYFLSVAAASQFLFQLLTDSSTAAAGP